MKRVLTAIVLIPLVLLVLFKAPMWLFTLAVGAVAMGAAWEYLGLVERYGLKLFNKAVLYFIALVFLLATLANLFAGNPFSVEARFAFVQSYPLLIWLAPFVILVIAMTRPELKTALPAAALSSLAIPYCLWSLLCLVWIRQRDDGVFLILFLFIVVWTGDIFAY